MGACEFEDGHISIHEVHAVNPELANIIQQAPLPQAWVPDFSKYVDREPSRYFMQKLTQHIMSEKILMSDVRAVNPRIAHASETMINKLRAKQATKKTPGQRQLRQVDIMAWPQDQ
eukprot:8229555-Karenia_brevis.AAC.1